VPGRGQDDASPSYRRLKAQSVGIALGRVDGRRIGCQGQTGPRRHPRKFSVGVERYLVKKEILNITLTSAAV